MQPRHDTQTAVRLPATRKIDASSQRAEGKGDEGVDVHERGTHLQAKFRRRTCHHNPAAHVVGTGIMVAGAAYCTVRGVLRLFHSMRRRALRCMLLDLVPVLEEAGCVYWLDFGTLLGVYRDEDIILHDNDCDIGILNPDWPRIEALLNKRLQHKGYWTKRVVASEDSTASWLRLRSHLGMADLFGATLQEHPSSSDSDSLGMEDAAQDVPGGGMGTQKQAALLRMDDEDGANAMLRINLGHGDCCDIPAALVLPTAKLEFRGCWMNVPGDVEGALEYRYGETWPVPRYMDKGADTVEQQKLYARMFSALGRLGIRL